MAKKTCPHCGASIESSRTVCPNCRAVIKEKSPVTPFLIVAGIAVVIIVVVAVLLLLPASQPTPPTLPKLTVPPTGVAAANPSSPSCTIAITGRKNPPAAIQLQVMTSTCLAGDITELRVSVNGAQKGTLNPNPGSGGTFTGTSGTDNVIVAAKFANGVESVVYQNRAL
jgi:predicted nucleic acid-binding Zn ribbon protein